METYLAHHGIIGMKWGIRRYQNRDGSLTAAGRKRYITKDRNTSPNQTQSPEGKPQSRTIRDMSNVELQAFIDRARLEQQYSEIIAKMNAKPESPAKKLIEKYGGQIANSIANEMINTLKNQLMKKPDPRTDLSNIDLNKLSDSDLAKVVKRISSEKAVNAYLKERG